MSKDIVEKKEKVFKLKVWSSEQLKMDTNTNTNTNITTDGASSCHMVFFHYIEINKIAYLYFSICRHFFILKCVSNICRNSVTRGARSFYPENLLVQVHSMPIISSRHLFTRCEWPMTSLVNIIRSVCNIFYTRKYQFFGRLTDVRRGSKSLIVWYVTLKQKLNKKVIRKDCYITKFKSTLYLLIWHLQAIKK